MILTIELTMEEEKRLEAARAKGFDLDALLRALIAGLPKAPETQKPTNRTAELFAQWETEDATDDPAELACREAEWEELKANLNENRAATGEEPLF